MSIFDNFLKPNEKDKIKSPRDSEQLVKDCLGEYKNLIDVSPHTKYIKGPKGSVMFSFTTRLMSLDFLHKLGKDRRVKNVFFTSRHSHPGGGTDSISLRHRVIIEYY